MGMLMLETCQEDNSVTNILLMNKENCALKLVDEIILYYDARSKKHQKKYVDSLVNFVLDISSIFTKMKCPHSRLICC